MDMQLFAPGELPPGSPGGYRHDRDKQPTRPVIKGQGKATLVLDTTKLTSAPYPSSESNPDTGRKHARVMTPLDGFRGQGDRKPSSAFCPEKNLSQSKRVEEQRAKQIFKGSGDATSVAEKHQRQEPIEQPQYVLWFATLQLHLLRDYPRLSCSVLLIAAALDLFSVILYITAEFEQVVWPKTTKQDRPQVDDYTNIRFSFVTQGVLSLLFTLEWIAVTAFGGFRRVSVANYYTFLCCLTNFPMHILSIGAMINVDVWAGAYLPFFMRIWWARRSLKKALMIRELGVSSLIRDIMITAMTVVCLMVTAASAFQVSENFSLRRIQIYWLDALYLTMVTFSTIGYGDVIPSTRVSKCALMVIIVIAISTFPGLMDKLKEFVTMYHRYRKYTPQKFSKHVVVAGAINAHVMSAFLNEFLSGKRKTQAINIVFLSPTPFDESCQIIAKNPVLAQRIMMLNGDPCDSIALHRAGATFADAMFVVLDGSLPAMRGDLMTLKQCWEASYFDPELPLYAMVRRAQYTEYLTSNVTFLDLDRIKLALMGQAVHQPGIIPFVINLMHSCESRPEDEAPEKWEGEYQASADNEVYTITCPPALIGTPFIAAVVILKKQFEVTLMAVVPEDSRLGILLNPKLRPLQKSDVLLFAASDDAVLTDNTYVTISSRDSEMSELISNECLQYFKEDDASESTFDLGASYVEIQAESPESSPLGSPRIRKTGSTTSDPPTDQPPTLTRHNTVYMASNPKKKVTIGKLEGHIVVIDASSTQEVGDSLTTEESIDFQRYKAEDLCTLFGNIYRHDENAQIVFLTRNGHTLSDENLKKFSDFDKATKNVICITGSIHDDALLELCWLGTAKGVIIFASWIGRFPLADNITGTLHQKVQSRLNPENPARIIVEADDVRFLSLLPPRFRSSGREKIAAADYMEQPKFFMGEAVSTTMLDSALFQSYFNKYLVEFMRCLLFGCQTVPGAQPPLPHAAPSNGVRSVRMKDLQRLTRTEGPTRQKFSEVLIRLARAGKVAVGILRHTRSAKMKSMFTHVDFSYIWTNAFNKADVKETDVIYYLD
eukprot:PhF_6_TR43389/c0_g1_i2/m.66597